MLRTKSAVSGAAVHEKALSGFLPVINVLPTAVAVNCTSYGNT
jgi:hypothetical protein